jgi:hypothetical protein
MKLINFSVASIFLTIAFNAFADGVYMPGLNPDIPKNMPGINWSPNQPRSDNTNQQNYNQNYNDRYNELQKQNDQFQQQQRQQFDNMQMQQQQFQNQYPN